LTFTSYAGPPTGSQSDKPFRLLAVLIQQALSEDATINAEKETPQELQARALLEREWRCQLDRIAPRSISIPTVDYRTPDGSKGCEVKRITNADYIKLRVAFTKVDPFYSERLTGRWSVIIDQPTLSTSLAPVPNFPDDDPQRIADLESYGIPVLGCRADREAAWRAAHPGPGIRTPMLKQLDRDLEPHLVILEQNGLKTTRGLSPFNKPQALAAAIRAIEKRTAGAWCLRRVPLTGERPGLDVILDSSSMRTRRANTIVDRLDLWLHSESDQSMNLRESLRNEESGTRRYAVLVFDAQTEPEHEAAIEQGTIFCPTIDLHLPEPIDVLWFILGPIACRFTPADKWRTVSLPDPTLGC